VLSAILLIENNDITPLLKAKGLIQVLKVTQAEGYHEHKKTFQHPEVNHQTMLFGSSTTLFKIDL